MSKNAKGSFFENNPFKGDKTLFSRFREEIETCVRGRIGNDWWESYLKPIHEDGERIDKKFIEWPDVQAIYEGQMVSIAGVKEIVKHNKLCLEKKEGVT